ncbi:SixA phosphatase family protein [Shewanella gaetbuli]|uniref:Histidine phosphatase family protein n=1 Tax=Shewanella gaetbuli TaxID=220752 RepID=A0A9X2CLY2_9GAMM|nr:histidine phosphatase family protein [Shewanella gaetbuli]MCL1143090.1 histidine phosphatase family protein [Shewanella gaetbuli]
MNKFLSNLAPWLMLCALVSPTTLATESSSITPHKVAEQQHKWTFILVRHGEKLKEKNPGLNPQGQARADRLAQMLAHIPLDKVYSTDYKRTLQTAEPTALHHNKTIEIYDPSELAAFTETLMTRPGTYLIVGHGNTTITLAKKLSLQTDVDKMDYTEDYDRLYFIEVNQMGNKQTHSIYRFSY